MTRPKAIWLGFALVILHNVEEQLGVGDVLAAHRASLPSFLRSMTGERFAISLAVVTLVAFAVAWAGADSRPNGPWLVLAIAFQVAMGVNAIQHLALGIWMRGWAPGMVTGVALLLPYAVYLARRALRERWVTARALFLTTAAVLVLAGPFLVAVHRLAMLMP